MKIMSSNSLRNKLIKAVDTLPLSVDVFGYEKKAKNSILAYISTLSKKIKVPKENIIIRIFNDQGHIRSCTYRHGQCVYEISMSELIRLFTGEYYDIEEKTEATILQMLKDISIQHCCDQNTLQLCISCPKDNHVSIRAITKYGFVTQITLKQLVAYFM